MSLVFILSFYFIWPRPVSLVHELEMYKFAVNTCSMSSGEPEIHGVFGSISKRRFLFSPGYGQDLYFCTYMYITEHILHACT